MAAAVLRVYQTQFDAHPAATLAATNGGLSAVADVVAQTAQMFVSLSHNSYHCPGKRRPPTSSNPLL